MRTSQRSQCHERTKQATRGHFTQEESGRPRNKAIEEEGGRGDKMLLIRKRCSVKGPMAHSRDPILL